MLFNSPVYFLIFLPLVFSIYFLLNKWSSKSGSKAILLLASLFFYGWYNIFNLPLIIFSIYFNFYIGRYIISHNDINKRKRIAFIAIIVNLLLLGFFKYLNFVILNFNILISYFDFNIFIPLFDIALPLAISFFTFQQIAYIVDIYRNKTKEYSFSNYALFVSFFPQLIAGPIVHHKEMMPQFASKRRKTINIYNIYRGLQYFAFGLLKKVVIADTLSHKVVDIGMASYKQLDFVTGWFLVLAYTLQLYFDFSGYCDMARGSAFLFNIKLPVNFNSPYKAVNIQDFWRRWHISLSTFLRDYIYIPLGGSRVTNIHIYMNILITFVLGGIWHGAGWNFLLWGVWHGIGIIVYLLFKKYVHLLIPSLVARVVTFVFVAYGWVFFKSENFTQIKDILSAISGLKDVSTVNINLLRMYTCSFSAVSITDLKFLIVLMFIFLLGCIVFLMPNTQQMIHIMHSNRRVLNHRYYIIYSVFIGFVLAMGIFFALSIKDSPFIYFNF